MLSATVYELTGFREAIRSIYLNKDVLFIKLEIQTNTYRIKI